MKRMIWIPTMLIALTLSATIARGQSEKKPEPAPAPAQTITSVLDAHLSVVEGDVVGAAEAMPEDKYIFAPSAGEFKGVRTFAEQVKHIAAANNNFANAILGQKPAADESGPDALKTKEQIVRYLKDSFAFLHKAFATITAENATTPLIGANGKPRSGPFGNRLGLALIGCWHPMDHYGQMVEYLRMNGIVPPESRPSK